MSFTPSRIRAAFERDDARVVFPDVYGVMNHVANLSVTSWLMQRVSPQPNR